MLEHPELDRPIWSSLTSVHNGYCVGSSRAKRFEDDVSPFAATIDEAPDSLSELVELIPANGSVMLLQVSSLVCPSKGQFSQTGQGVQMLFNGFRHQPERTHDFIKLSAADAADMCALAELTRPGPFKMRTHCLGDFLGIKIDGKLIAMAGERLKQRGYTEISGICTHPDYTGRGLAGQLTMAMVSRVLDRGEMPYLHAFSSNIRAIKLYQQLGFEHRANVNVAILHYCPE